MGDCITVEAFILEYSLVHMYQPIIRGSVAVSNT